MGHFELDQDVLNLLACPRDGLPLRLVHGRCLRCEAGHEYPIVDGVPVFLLEGIKPTMDATTASLERSRAGPPTGEKVPELHLESLGISESEKDAVEKLWLNKRSAIDPVVQYLVGATCGIAYKGALGNLVEYPIPEIPLPPANASTFLDVGCNWGRWSIAAARKGYRVIGIDPQLGAVVAAKRVSEQLGQRVTYLCGDARRLPLRSNQQDVVFSYSVLQHFSRQDCELALQEVGRVLKPNGRSVIQMANALGLRNLYQLSRRRFRQGKDFEVRYYLPAHLRSLFETAVGRTSLTADCFLGLGLQDSDIPILTGLGQVAARSSRQLKRASRIVGGLALFADSLYVRSVKP
jgi:2-polyprenyl-3-methyl-5-hydroxy-6-metoxy-1,4-benzoquinol methylase/uncharacterized protein YbaR (Trm112 family)